jgi:FixJ family two-component response regulator
MISPKLATTRRQKMRMQALKTGAAEFVVEPFDELTLSRLLRAARDSRSRN